jgi:glucose-1-phosphate cytidylyltransferase
MKVVIFCGGLGTRLRDFSEAIPKPLVPLGSVPIMLHVMRYYAHFGHRDFVLCLGYKADAIKRYFKETGACAAEDCAEPGAECIIWSSHFGKWRITFADTGLNSNIGQRLKAVEPFVKSEDVFLANYADGLSDLPLPTIVDEFRKRKAVGMFVSVRPNASFHFVRQAADGRVLSVDDIEKANTWINGGYFVLSNEIFRYMRPGEELVEEPFRRLIDEGRLFTLQYHGFWRCIDTFKDLQALENLLTEGQTPWSVWQSPTGGAPTPRAKGTVVSAGPR